MEHVNEQFTEKESLLSHGHCLLDNLLSKRHNVEKCTTHSCLSNHADHADSSTSSRRCNKIDSSLPARMFSFSLDVSKLDATEKVQEDKVWLLNQCSYEDHRDFNTALDRNFHKNYASVGSHEDASMDTSSPPPLHHDDDTMQHTAEHHGVCVEKSAAATCPSLEHLNDTSSSSTRHCVTPPPPREKHKKEEDHSASLRPPMGHFEQAVREETGGGDGHAPKNARSRQNSHCSDSHRSRRSSCHSHRKDHSCHRNDHSGRPKDHSSDRKDHYDSRQKDRNRHRSDSSHKENHHTAQNNHHRSSSHSHSSHNSHGASHTHLTHKDSHVPTHKSSQHSTHKNGHVPAHKSSQHSPHKERHRDSHKAHKRSHSGSSSHNKHDSHSRRGSHSSHRSSSHTHRHSSTQEHHSSSSHRHCSSSSSTSKKRDQRTSSTGSRRSSSHYHDSEAENKCANNINESESENKFAHIKNESDKKCSHDISDLKSFGKVLDSQESSLGSNKQGFGYEDMIIKVHRCKRRRSSSSSSHTQGSSSKRPKIEDSQVSSVQRYLQKAFVKDEDSNEVIDDDDEEEEEVGLKKDVLEEDAIEEDDFETDELEEEDDDSSDSSSSESDISEPPLSPIRNRRRTTSTEASDTLDYDQLLTRQMSHQLDIIQGRLPARKKHSKRTAWDQTIYDPEYSDSNDRAALNFGCDRSDSNSSDESENEKEGTNRNRPYNISLNLKNAVPTKPCAITLDKLDLHGKTVVDLKNFDQLKRNLSNLSVLGKKGDADAGSSRSNSPASQYTARRHFLDVLSGTSSPVGSPGIIMGNTNKGNFSPSVSSLGESRRNSQDSERGSIIFSPSHHIAHRNSEGEEDEEELSDNEGTIISSDMPERRISELSDRGSSISGVLSPMPARRNSELSEKVGGVLSSYLPSPLYGQKEEIVAAAQEKDDGNSLLDRCAPSDLPCHGPMNLRRLPRLASTSSVTSKASHHHHHHPSYSYNSSKGTSSPAAAATVSRQDTLTGRYSRNILIGALDKPHVPALFSVPMDHPAAGSEIKKNKCESELVDIFASQQEESIYANLEEPTWRHKVTGAKSVYDMTTSSNTPSPALVEELVKLLIMSPSRCHAIQIHMVLMNLLHQHPPFGKLGFTWKQLEGVVQHWLNDADSSQEKRFGDGTSDLTMGNETDTEEFVEPKQKRRRRKLKEDEEEAGSQAFAGCLALQYMVRALEADVLQRSFRDQMQLNRSVIFRWFPVGPFQQMQQLLKWIVRLVVLTAGATGDGMDRGIGNHGNQDAGVSFTNTGSGFSGMGSVGSMGSGLDHSRTDQGYYNPSQSSSMNGCSSSGQLMLSLLDSLLELRLSVHPHPEQLTSRCATELQGHYMQLSTLQQRSLLLESLSSPLLLFKLCQRVLEDHCSVQATYVDTYTLEDLLPAYFNEPSPPRRSIDSENPNELPLLSPPSRHPDTPPPSPLLYLAGGPLSPPEEDVILHSGDPLPPLGAPLGAPLGDSSPLWSPESCEELCLLLWKAVQGYVMHKQYRLNVSVPRRLELQEREEKRLREKEKEKEKRRSEERRRKEKEERRRKENREREERKRKEKEEKRQKEREQDEIKEKDCKTNLEETIKVDKNTEEKVLQETTDKKLADEKEKQRLKEKEERRRKEKDREREREERRRKDKERERRHQKEKEKRRRKEESQNKWQRHRLFSIKKLEDCDIAMLKKLPEFITDFTSNLILHVGGREGGKGLTPRTRLYLSKLTTLQASHV